MTANDRAFDLLEMIIESPEPRGLGELVSASGLTKPTVRRLLLGLEGQGFVRQDAQRRYVVGARVLDVAATALGNVDLVADSQGVLSDLRSRLSATVTLSVYADRQLHPAATLAPNAPYKVAGRGVAATGLHATAAGKSVLACLSDADVGWLLGTGELERYTAGTVTDPGELRAQLGEVLRRGYAVNDEESQPGVRCVAAPVRNYLSRPMAAVSVSVAASQGGGEWLTEQGSLVAAAADEIGSWFGGPELRQGTGESKAGARA
ncbi:IclR family transcriptional regulator [Sciscionella sediminilitoris]|uniref:IclR family transcriptional regulator n=1 Tax=Sciscionella sediminilitoris TaxID=1445613 RepID=UPI0004DF4FB4|nr:IclR family transcriptional regulator [Sciscionella sp. SE31]